MARPLPILLMTRPLAASERFIDELRADGITAFQPVISALTEIVLAGALPQMTQTDGLIFTSINGVNSYVALGGAPGRRAFCVGDATAVAAQKAGLNALSAHGDAEDLLAMLRAAPPGVALWHLHGTHARGDLVNRLNALGIVCGETVLYDQRACPLNDAAIAALAGTVPVVAPLLSPRSAIQFSDQLNAQKLGKTPLFLATISKAVAEAVDVPYLIGMNIAAQPTAVMLRREVAILLKDATMLEAGGDAQ